MNKYTKAVFFLCFSLALYGCQKQKEMISISEYESAAPDAALSHDIQEVKEETSAIQTKEQKSPEEKAKPLPNNEKFKIEDDNLPIEEQTIENTISTKPIMVAVMAPMSGKEAIIGNSMMDGGYIGLMELFDKHKIPVRITAIDTGSTVEDMECNISKLDENDFDIIVKFLSEEQEKFVDLYITHQNKKPYSITLNPYSKDVQSCGVTPYSQFQTVIHHVNSTGNKPLVFLVLPSSEDEKNWIKNTANDLAEVEVLKYTNNDVQKTTDDIQQIVQKINQKALNKIQNTNSKVVQVFVIFTENNWKLSKLTSQMETIKTSDMHLKIILASLSNKSAKIESILEKRHKFCDILVTVPAVEQYEVFAKRFHNEYHRKPFELAFWSYNTILNLKDSKFTEEKWKFPSDLCTTEVMIK